MTKKTAEEQAHEAIMHQANHNREDARRYRELLSSVREIRDGLRQTFTHSELKHNGLASFYYAMNVLSKGIK